MCYEAGALFLRVITQFGSMGIMRLLQSRYNIRFEQVMTDNGSEFKSNKTMGHPFERLLHQLEIKHIYTRPYKPQANGKRRVWEW
jgi:transposase InsO family protein